MFIYKAVAVITLVMAVLVVQGFGQFQSGSTGVDGAFSPTVSQALQLPETGVFNFTTVNIPQGVTITFIKNSKNTPVTMLASGNVTIGGTIDLAGKAGQVNGLGGEGGAGGYRGGNGGFGTDNQIAGGSNGDGPGAGRGGLSSNVTTGSGGGHATVGKDMLLNFQPVAGTGGSRYGTSLLQPLTAGSGGGGSSAASNLTGKGGGGGGGAILIASSTTITLSTTAVIDVRGGNAEGAGAAGAVRIIANTVAGSGYFRAIGGMNSTGGIVGGSGYLRVEGFNLTGLGLFSESSVPIVLSTPNAITIANLPQLKIVSVAGQAVPNTPQGLLAAAPDIVLPVTQSTAIVVIEGRNLPTAISANIVVVPITGAPSQVVSSVFSATAQSGVTTATATVNLAVGISVIYASATIDLAVAKLEPMFIEAEQVEKIKVTALYGSSGQLTYITKSGRRITVSQ